jgi:hypothetical protein
MPVGAVYVGRPGRWGNPFQIRGIVMSDHPLWAFYRRFLGENGYTPHGLNLVIETSFDAVVLHREMLRRNRVLQEQIRHDLAGRDLVCWCPPTSCCHADTLIAVATGGVL